MTKTLRLSVQDTQVLKGMAILLLLCHHCLSVEGDYDDIVMAGIPIFQSIGNFCKLCVAIFVFLSGYGLMTQCLKNEGMGSVLQFYRRRYVKLMINFWIIWLLFVPVGGLLFNRTFPVVYGEHYVVRGILDLAGICTTSSYNATWWFYGCIILLYAIFPLIWRYRQYWFLLLPVSFMLNNDLVRAIPVVNLIDNYLFVFVCGAVFAYVPIRVGGGKLAAFCLLVAFSIFRFHVSIPSMWDVAITISAVYLYALTTMPSYAAKVLSFFGRHSSNIFLFHTFIYAYFFHDLIFWNRNPFLIVSTLLVVCIAVSMTIEWLKRTLKVGYIQDKLMA